MRANTSNRSVIINERGAAILHLHPQHRVGEASIIAAGASRLMLKIEDDVVVGLRLPNVHTIVVPSGVTEIGPNAFCRCDTLTSLTLPSTLTNVGPKAFFGCKALTSLSLPDTLTYVGNNAFTACSSLTSITLPDTVTHLRKGVFFKCSALTSLTLQDCGQVNTTDNIGCTALRIFRS